MSKNQILCVCGFFMMCGGCFSSGSHQTGRIIDPNQKTVQVSVSTPARIVTAEGAEETFETGLGLEPISLFGYNAGFAQVHKDWELRWGIENFGAQSVEDEFLFTIGGFSGAKHQIVGDKDSIFAMALDFRLSVNTVIADGLFLGVAELRLGAPMSAHLFDDKVALYFDPTLRPTGLLADVGDLFTDTDSTILFHPTVGARIGKTNEINGSFEVGVPIDMIDENNWDSAVPLVLSLGMSIPY